MTENNSLSDGFGKNDKKILNLQDLFLNIARRERISVTVYMTNGFQMKGIIKGFDNYVIMIDCEGRYSMIYKHAVSTMTPSRPIDIMSEIK